MDEAKTQIKMIKNYLSNILCEPIIAKKTIQTIQEKISDLSYMPRKYQLLRKDADTEIRRMIVKNYIIIYQVNNEIETVIIINIFYVRRNYLKFI